MDEGMVAAPSSDPAESTRTDRSSGHASGEWPMGGAGGAGSDTPRSVTSTEQRPALCATVGA
jgi:hypothetical protein